MAESDKNKTSMTPTQLGRAIGAALKASSVEDAISKSLFKQLDIDGLAKSINKLTRSASALEKAVKSMSSGGGSDSKGGSGVSGGSVSEIKSITTASDAASESLEVLNEHLTETAGDGDDSAMGIAIKTFQTMIESNETLQEQVEATKAVYDLLGKIIQASSKKSETAVVTSSAKQVTANTAATASNAGKAVSGATANSMMLPPPFNVIALGAGIAAIVGALAMLAGGSKSAGISGSAPSAGGMPTGKAEPEAKPPEKKVAEASEKKKSEEDKDNKKKNDGIDKNTAAVKTLTNAIISQGKTPEEPSEAPAPAEPGESEAATPPAAEQKKPAEKKEEKKGKEESAPQQGKLATAINKLSNLNPAKTIQNAILGPFAGLGPALKNLKEIKASDWKQRLNPFAGFKEAFKTQVLGKPPSEQKKTAEAGKTPESKPAEKPAAPEAKSSAPEAKAAEPAKATTAEPTAAPAEKATEPATPEAAPAEKTAEPATPEAAPAVKAETPAPAATAAAAVPAKPEPAAPSAPIPPPIDGRAAQKEAQLESAALKSASAAKDTALAAEQKVHDAKMGMLSEEKASQTELMDQIRAESEEKASLLEQEATKRSEEFDDKKKKNKGMLGFLQAEGKMEEWKTNLTIKQHAKELASSAKKFAADMARTGKAIVAKGATAAINVVKWAFNLPFPINLVALAGGGVAVAAGIAWALGLMKGGGGAGPKGQDPGEAKEEETPQGSSPSADDVASKGDKNAVKSMSSLSMIGIAMLVYERKKKETYEQMLEIMRSIDKKLDNVGGGGSQTIVQQVEESQGGGKNDNATSPNDPFEPFRYATNRTR